MAKIDPDPAPRTYRAALLGCGSGADKQRAQIRRVPAAGHAAAGRARPPAAAPAPRDRSGRPRPRPADLPGMAGRAGRQARLGRSSAQGRCHDPETCWTTPSGTPTPATCRPCCARWPTWPRPHSPSTATWRCLRARPIPPSGRGRSAPTGWRTWAWRCRPRPRNCWRWRASSPTTTPTATARTTPTRSLPPATRRAWARSTTCCRCGPRSRPSGSRTTR